MEQFDIEQQQQRRLQPPGDPPGNRLTGRARKLIAGRDGIDGQLISLRKYSAAICLVEALAIVLLIYLLLKLPTPLEEARFSQGLVSDTSSPPYRIYSDHLSSARLLLGLARNCSQRQHDLAHSIRCHSHTPPGECAPVEQLTQTTILGDNELEGGGGGKFVLEIIETSRAGSRLAKRREHATRKVLDPRATKVNTLAVVHRQWRHQQIIGWGGALTDSTINNVLSLTTNATRNLLDDYFGAHGLRFNLVRVTIGGSDFSARFYTNDDFDESARSVDAGEQAGEQHKADWSLSKFKLMEEDQLYKIPMLKFIQSEYFGAAPTGSKLPVERGQFKVFASMWSPPVWLKDNRHFNKGQLRAFGQGANSSRHEAFGALARLKIKWLEAYSEAGVNSLWGLTVMNEPVFAVQPFLNFNTMIFPRDDYAHYLAHYLGPQIREHTRLGHLKLMVHDDNRRFLNDFTRPLLADNLVRAYIDGVSVHGYTDEEYGQMSALYREFSKPTSQTDLDKSLFVLPTELCSGHLPFMEKALAGNWHRGVHYALDIVRSLQAMAAGWVDWNMVLDMEGGPGWLGGRLDAPILVDRASDTYHRSPMFYVLGQFSRYIPAGSRRLELEIQNAKYDKHYELVAFETPRASIVLVAVNNNHYPVTLHWRIDDSEDRPPPRGVAAGSAEDLDEAGKEFFVVTSPAESVQTIVFETKTKVADNFNV